MGKSIDIASADDVFSRFLLGIVFFGAGLWWAANLTPRDSPWGPFILLGIGFTIMLTCRQLVSNPMLALRYKLIPARVVHELIESWVPEKSEIESDHEKSLHAFLKRELPFVKITRQYGSGRVKCDIATGREVFIELKAGFSSTQKLQRLIGQVELYHREWGKPVFVVLVGSAEDDLLKDLRKSIDHCGQVAVITKEFKAARAKASA